MVQPDTLCRLIPELGRYETMQELAAALERESVYVQDDRSVRARERREIERRRIVAALRQWKQEEEQIA